MDPLKIHTTHTNLLCHLLCWPPPSSVSPTVLRPQPPFITSTFLFSLHLSLHLFCPHLLCLEVSPHTPWCSAIYLIVGEGHHAYLDVVVHTSSYQICVFNCISFFNLLFSLHLLLLFGSILQKLLGRNRVKNDFFP